MAATSTGIVFIDANLPDLDQVLAQLAPGLAVHLIPSDGDGLAFIADTLSGQSNVEAVHILSHGAPGTLVLGNLALTEAGIADRAADMAVIRDALAEFADILIYGCDIAAGDVGEAFVQALATATGADVAASTDTTGLGGDWDLEYSTGSVEAGALSFAEFNAPLLTAPYTENAAAVQIDPALALAATGAGDDYSGGSLLIEGSGAAGETLGFVQSGTPDITAGAITVVGAGVYRGTGTIAEVIGSIDSVKNGQNGADLLVNFSVGFTNGTIDTGTAGSGTIEGWTTGTTMVNMGSTEIAGWVTPVDTTYPTSNTTGDVSTNTRPGSQTVSLSDHDAGYTGDLAIRLNTGSYSIAEGYGIIRGPYVYSNGTVVLQEGDSVAFAWKALSGGDAFDAYGYLLNVATGETITLLDQTGTSANQETAWATVSQSIGAGQDGEYRFVFVAGSYDLTGGRYVGGELMIDDVSVTQANPPAPVQEFDVNVLARLTTFASTAEDFDETAVTITYTATPGTPGTATTSYTATNTVAITETNDAPEFTSALALGSALPGGVIEGTVSAFATAAFSDADSQFAPFDTLGGIAISGNPTDPADGDWSYSTDGGDTWVALPAVSAGSALVLDPAAVLRFEPADGFTGTPSLTVHAIDSTWSAGFTTVGGEVRLDTTAWVQSAPFSETGVALEAAYEQLVSPTASFGYADTVVVDDFTAQSGTVSAVTDSQNTGRSYSYAIDGGTDAGDGTDVLVTAYGTLTLDRTTGAWGFEPDDAAINALADGDVEAVAFALNILDGAGGMLTQTLTLNLTGANDPILFEAGDGAQFLARGEGVLIAEELSLADDGAALVGKATVSLVQGVRDNSFGTAYETLSLSAEALEAANLAGLLVEIVNGDTGSVLTLTGSATPQVYETILRGIVYTNDNPNAVVGIRTIDFEIEDTVGNLIETDSADVEVAWAPWFDMNGPTGSGLVHQVTHVEDAPAIAIATSDAQILDQDGTISSVTVTLTNPLDNTGGMRVEFLSVTAPVLALLASHGILIGASDGTLDDDGNLTGATEITFSASAGETATRFQTALRGVQYTNTSDNPTQTDRVVSVNGVDSDGNLGLGGETIIHIEGTNDAPTATPETAIGTEDADFVFDAQVFGFSDAIDGGANLLAGVLVDTLPASGTLWLDGVELTGPTEVTVAEIDAGLFVYRPAPDVFGAGIASFDFRLRDDSGAANDLSGVATLTIDLAPENDAPVLTITGNGTLNQISEDVSLALNTGSTVAEILAASTLAISDVDLQPGSEPQAIAVTGFDTTNGTWQVKIADGEWTAVDFAALDSGNALLLGAGDALRFLPELDWNGTVENAVTFRAWDMTSGTAGDYVALAANAGGTGFISLESGSADITVAAVDDAPFISGRASVTLQEDGTALIDGFTIGDADGDDLSVRITMPDPAAGTLELLETTGIAGTTSGAVLEVSGSIADLQAALNSLQYTAAPDWNGSFDLQLEVSDDEGATWQPYSVGQVAAAPLTIEVASVNDAPLLAANDAGFVLTEDDQNNQGHLVSDLLGSTTTDVDAGAHDANNGTLQGIAVFAPEADNGGFEFSLDGGLNWQSVVLAEGEVLLLRDTDLIRHEPDAQNGGTASFGYHAWDQSTGVAGDVVAGIAGAANAANRGGISAYSTDAATVSYQIDDVDDAPALTANSDAEYYARGPAVAVFGPGDLLLSDVDAGASLTGATVTLDPATAVDNLFGTWESLGFEGGPVLTTSSGAVLTVSGTDTALSLSGNGTLDDYTEALEALRYMNANPNMTVGPRSVILTITDDTGLTSAPVTATVDAEWATVVDLNGAGTGRDHAVGYTEGMTGVAIATADAELIDQDGITHSITATLLDALNGSDEILFIDPSTVTQLQTLYGITVSGNETDAITLTAAAGLDPTYFQAALRTIQYANASTNPTDADRHVLVETVDMAGHPGISATTTINVTPVNSVAVVGDVTAPDPVTELADASAQVVELAGSVALSDGDIGEAVELVVTGTPSAVWSGGAELPQSVDLAALIDPAALTLGSIIADGTAQSVSWSYAATADLDWLAEGETLTLSFDLAGDDGHAISDAEPLVITIVGTNDAPTAVTLSATQIEENQPNGDARIVASLGAADADISDSGHAFAIATGDDGFLFELVNGNELKFRDGVVLDAEGRSSYTVNLSATDSLGQSVTTQHVITVGDVNEFAVTIPVFDVTPIIAGMRPNLIPVDTADGTFIGVTAISTDADTTDEVVLYELVGNQAGSAYTAGIFSIDATGPDAGRIHLADASALTIGTAYDVFVRAISSDGSSQISSIRVEAAPSLVTLGDTLVNATEAGSVPFEVSGLSAGATAVVTFSDGTNDVALTVSADGSHSVDLDGLVDGQVSVTVNATSATGTSSGAVAVGAIMLDTIGPVGAPHVAVAMAATPAGALPVATISGLETDAMWEYSQDDGATWTMGSGNSVTLPSDSHGPTLVRQVDAAGNAAPEIIRIHSGDAQNFVLTGSTTNDHMSGWHGDDTLNGGAGNDTLAGGAGNDSLVGGAGVDRMFGNIGDDDYFVDNAFDRAMEGAGNGHDRVFSSVTFTIEAHIEELHLTGTGNLYGTGNSGDNRINGTSGSNWLLGEGGNDVLIGGAGNDKLFGGSGVDTMYGGTGNDDYYVDNSFDRVVEGPGGGLDRVYTTATFTLDDHVEELRMQGSADINGTGNSGNNRMIGNDGDNWLVGQAGNDVFGAEDGDDKLDGGAGVDWMFGGAGRDTFILQDGWDSDRVLDFEAGPGGDFIRLRDVTAIVSYADLTASHLTANAAGDAVIYDGSGNFMTLQGIAVGALTVDNFIF